MGREIKRVPIDLDYTIGEVWPGFLMPADLRLPQCPDCTGSGQTASAHWLHAIARMLVMAGDDLAEQKRGRPLHPWLADLPVYANGARPSEDIHALIKGLDPDADPDTFMGYSSNVSYHITRKLVEAAGLDHQVWGICPRCGGEGDIATAEQKAAYEAWEETPVPEGDGWQLWSTTTEGHPMSPVFATGDELARWMSENPCGFAGARFSLETARAWVNGSGWAPSMMSSPETGLQDGITASVAVTR